MCLEPKYAVFPGGLPYLLAEDGGMHLVYDMLQRRDGLYVLNFASLLVLDYDTPSERHLTPSAVVGKGLSDLLMALDSSDPIFEKYGLPGGATWRIHRTAGGFHAFRMDIAIPPSARVADMLEELSCDPGYASLVRNTLTWPIRVSRKSSKEDSIYTVVAEAHGVSPVCEECRLQVWLYEQMVRKYGY